MKNKAPRNKTIDTPVSEGKDYLSRCIAIEKEIDNISAIIDKTVLGDTFSVCPLLPKESIDLIIADPPYNLNKQFNGSKFAKMNVADYEGYTRRWLSA